MMKTDLSQRQINVISVLSTYADMYDIIPIKKLIANLLKLQISKGRASRREIVDMMQHKTQEQEDKKITKLGKNQSFGEIAMLTGQTRTATVRALEDTTTWTIIRKDFEYLMNLSPTLRKTVNELMERRVGDLKEREFVKPIRAKY